MTKRFALGAVGVFVMRGCSVALHYVALVIMTRTLGKVGYGVYALAAAWLSLLTIPGLMGLDRLVVREVASAHAHGGWGRIRGLLEWANRVGLMSACVTAGVGMLGVGVLGRLGYAREEVVQAMCVMFAVLPVNVLSNVRQSALRGLHRVVWGFLPDLVVLPVVLCVGVAVMRWGFPRQASPLFAVGAGVTASVVAFGVGAWLLGRALTREIREAVPEVRAKEWGRALLPLMLVSAMYIVNSRTDQAMIGGIVGSAAVGVYAAAVRVADLVIFFIVATNAMLAPVAARLYAKRDMEGLQRTVTLTARWVAGLSLPTALILLAGSSWILGIFGQEFKAGAVALRWLCCGQIVNACAGSVALLLTTTGYERDALRGITLGAIVNVIGNAVLIPWRGIEGAAMATAASTVVWNVVLAVYVYRRLGINPTMFARVRKPYKEA